MGVVKTLPPSTANHAFEFELLQHASRQHAFFKTSEAQTVSIAQMRQTFSTRNGSGSCVVIQVV